MKFLLSVSFFALTTAVAHAGPGSRSSKMIMTEMAPNASKYACRSYTRSGGLRMDSKIYSTSPHVQRRSFHTKLRTEGYKPKETAEIPQRHILPWPKKVEYLDDTYEIFRTPPGFIEMLEESVKRSHKETPSLTTEEKKK